MPLKNVGQGDDRWKSWVNPINRLRTPLSSGAISRLISGLRSITISAFTVIPPISMRFFLSGVKPGEGRAL